MNTNAKIALGMAVPAAGMFVGALMLKGPKAQLGGAGKPIRIEKIKWGYYVYVEGKPVVRRGKRLNIGVRGEFPTELSKTEAIHAAHQAGRYLLDLGDLVYTYTELVNVPGDHEAWWNRAR